MPWPLGQVHNFSSAGNGYGCGPTHQGINRYAIDFNFTNGQEVSAVADGVAHNVNEDDSGGYGNLVWIDHGNGFVSVYAHLESFALAEGTNVFHGTVVGLSDNTGNSTGSHLHFALRSDASTWYNGTAYKPEPMSGYSGFDQYGACTGSSSQDLLYRLAGRGRRSELLVVLAP
ncbi:MAG TPA: M23 family metallopeptidase [Dehalococcoidia bacterium]|nr:M23 family metallopeptidase [Dehalococcoidia bacterium]